MRRLLLPLLLLVSLLVGLIWAAEYDRGPLVVTKENQFKVIVGLGGPKAVLVEPGWILRKGIDGSLLLTKKSAVPSGAADRTG